MRRTRLVSETHEDERRSDHERPRVYSGSFRAVTLLVLAVGVLPCRSHLIPAPQVNAGEDKAAKFISNLEGNGLTVREGPWRSSHGRECAQTVRGSMQPFSNQPASTCCPSVPKLPEQPLFPPYSWYPGRSREGVCPPNPGVVRDLAAAGPMRPSSWSDHTPARALLWAPDYLFSGYNPTRTRAPLPAELSPFERSGTTLGIRQTSSRSTAPALPTAGGTPSQPHHLHRDAGPGRRRPVGR